MQHGRTLSKPCWVDTVGFCKSPFVELCALCNAIHSFDMAATLCTVQMHLSHKSVVVLHTVDSSLDGPAGYMLHGTQHASLLAVDEK